ncbi:hypothetical protein CDD80_1285 [Ophiocordyceps camponoti-rufipedis]|uniref:Uncharacterized protein n=1 Tax=Ophiocordyceps camponoti-rufipedis TaxID=2004952 RepID=A0A2C5ZAC8_9HYPO|nr:hypothetical protein CDD80_1285 [Ophiocordyceps camponoti-rufipedis]
MNSPGIGSPPNFRSAYGPKSVRLGLYGGAAGVAALLFTSGIPRIRVDIMERIPFVGHFFVKEPVNPADNVSFARPQSYDLSLTSKQPF